MKRDMDLARLILAKVEDDPDADGLGSRKLSVEGRSDQEVTYHVQLLDEAGLVTMEEMRTSSGLVCLPRRLTWQGHEFLEAARSDTLWQKAKKITVEKTGGLGFEFLKTALTKLGMDAIGAG